MSKKFIIYLFDFYDKPLSKLCSLYPSNLIIDEVSFQKKTLFRTVNLTVVTQ